VANTKTKRRTVFGTPAIGKLRSLPMHTFRDVDGQIKIVQWAVFACRADEGLPWFNLQFTSGQMYVDQNGDWVDAQYRTCEYDTRAAGLDYRRLVTMLYMLNIRQHDGDGNLLPYDPEALANIVLDHYMKQYEAGAAWTAPAGFNRGRVNTP